MEGNVFYATHYQTLESCHNLSEGKQHIKIQQEIGVYIWIRMAVAVNLTLLKITEVINDHDHTWNNLKGIPER